MKLTEEEKALLLEAAESAAHYYSNFLLHDDWEVGLSPEEVQERKDRISRFCRAIEVAKKL